MKTSLTLLLLSTFCVASFSSCNTLVNRRELYAPNRADGPYTKMVDDMRGEKIMRYSHGEYDMVTVRRETKTKTLYRMRR